MDSKIIAIIAVSYLYGFFEVFMNFRQRRKNNVKTSTIKGVCGCCMALLPLAILCHLLSGQQKSAECILGILFLPLAWLCCIGLMI